MNPEQWLSLKWNGGSTMSDRWLNQSKIIQDDRNAIGILFNMIFPIYTFLPNIFSSKFQNINIIYGISRKKFSIHSDVKMRWPVTVLYLYIPHTPHTSHNGFIHISRLINVLNNTMVI